MNFTKPVLVILLVASICISQDVKISGFVKNNDVELIQGAVVKLENIGITATTQVDGSFELTGTTIELNSNNFQSPILSARAGNGGLYVNLRVRTTTEIITYTLQGKAVSRMKKAMDIGTHHIAPC